MGRKKTQLSLIANENQRNTAFKNRKKSLLKMADELSTLCGVETCAIVYGPNDDEVGVWPSDSGVHSVVEKFRSRPGWEQSQKMVNQEIFIEQSITKGKEKLHKIENQNKEMEMFIFMCQCLNSGNFEPPNNITSTDLDVLSSLIDQNLREITRTIKMLKVNQGAQSQNQPQIETPPSFQPQMPTPAFHDMTLLNCGNGSNMNIANPMQRKGFMDLLNGDSDSDDEDILSSYFDE